MRALHGTNLPWSFLMGTTQRAPENCVGAEVILICSNPGLCHNWNGKNQRTNIGPSLSVGLSTVALSNAVVRFCKQYKQRQTSRQVQWLPGHQECNSGCF